MMKKRLRIGIVGCGAIGTSLAKIVVKDLKLRAQLSSVFDIDPSKMLNTARIAGISGKCCVKDLRSLIAGSDLVIEAASAGSSFDISRKVLSAGKDIVVMSVGGVVEKYQALIKLAGRRNARLYIPSGAICGIDALKAAMSGRISSVTLITSKPPRSFKSVPYIREHDIDLDAIHKDTVLFSGTATQAMKHFPQNINVAGILSLAGIGPDATKVRIVASPSATRNTHEIVIESDSGRIITRTENVIHPDNPKTSYLAVLSAAALIRQILDPGRIGT
jgi:aspartate dehydrogenase